MKYKYVFSLFVQCMFGCDIFAQSLRRDSGSVVVDKYMMNFTNHLKQWEATLTSEQKEEFQDLIEYYFRVYEQYQQNPSNQKNQLQMQEIKQLLEKIIQSWNPSQKSDDKSNLSLKEYSEIKIFNDAFQKWNQIISISNQKKYKKVIDHYQRCFDEYDKNPKDVNNKKRLLKAQKEIKKRMEVAL